MNTVRQSLFSLTPSNSIDFMVSIIDVLPSRAASSVSLKGCYGSSRVERREWLVGWPTCKNSDTTTRPIGPSLTHIHLFLGEGEQGNAGWLPVSTVCIDRVATHEKSFLLLHGE